MSVLGHKITELTPLKSLQPGDTFLAIRGGVSYKILGDRFATVDQINLNKLEYTTKINTIQQTVDEALLSIGSDVEAISAIVSKDFFLSTSGVLLSTAVFGLSSYALTQIADIKSNYALTSHLNHTLSSTTSTFLTRASAEKIYIPYPGAQYGKENGRVLTWSSAANAWIPGPLLTSSIDLGPVGTIILYAGTTAPLGYLLCDGQTVIKEDYPELWEAIGDSYGRPPGLPDDSFNVPDLTNMGIIVEERPDKPSLVYSIFCIKAIGSVRTTLMSELTAYVKLGEENFPLDEQYLMYLNGEWIATTLPTTSALPTTAPLSSVLAWNGDSWTAATPQVQSIYELQSIVVNDNSSCVFTNIPVTAKKITLVISNLDITPTQGNLVELKLGANGLFVNSGYNNATHGVYTNTYIRTSNGYYSYTTNTLPNTDACYLLVRGETLESREYFGGLDTIITFMRSQQSLINSTSKWVYTHTGRIGASVIHGAGSVTLDTPSPDMIGIFSPNPAALLTTGNITLYWE